MDVNDNAGSQTPRSVLGFIASKLAPTRGHALHPPILSHRQRIAIANDEMVEHPHINQFQRLLQTLGQHPVGLTGVTVARWMVVTVLCPIFLCAARGA